MKVHFLEPALISVIIKADRRRKRFPTVGEMVRLKNRKGLLMVTRVDEGQQVADLMQRVGYREQLEKNVPFSRIGPVPRQASRAIHSFLHS